MMNLVCGACGTGKSAYVYSKIAEALKDGDEVLLIVPDQQAVAAEEALAALCEGFASYKLQIYSFSRLCNAAFRKYGGLSYTYIDKTTCNLVVFLALCSVYPGLLEYNRVAVTDSTLLSSLYNSIREFRQYGVRTEDLREFLDSDDPRISERLRNKLNDLWLICSAYEKIVSSGNSDPLDDLGRLDRLLDEHDFFRGTRVFLDSFITYTPMQLKIIARILRGAKELTLSVCAPQNDAAALNNPMFEPVYDTEKRLVKLASDAGEKAEIIALDKQHRFKNPELAAVEAGLRGGVVYSEACDNVKIYACKNAFEEADVIAADICRRVRDEKISYGDIAVCIRGVNASRGIIDAALEKYNIPFYFSARTDAREKSPIRLVLSALNVCVRNFRREDVISYIKTGLIDIPQDKTDLFEYYVSRREITGKKFYAPDPWDENPDGFCALDENGMAVLTTVNEVRYKIITPLYDLSVQLSNGGTAKELSVFLFEFLDKIGMRTILSRQIADSVREEAQELTQLWGVIVSASESLVRYCGDTALNASQFYALLDMIFSQTDIGTIPTAVDRVTVGEAGLMRAENARVVYVPSVNEGRFPADISEDGILGDSDRLLLAEHGIRLADVTEKASVRELLDFYRTLCTPREALILSYAIADLEGKELRPSYALKNVTNALTKLKICRAPEWYELIQSKEAAFEYCAAHPDKPQGQALYRIFGKDPEYAGRLKALRLPITVTDERLTKETAARITPGALRMSASSLKKFHDCEFSYCCSYILKLRESGAVEFQNNDFGTFIHYIMKRLIDDCVKNPEVINSTDTELSDLVDGYMREYISAQLGVDISKSGTGKLRALFNRMKKNVLICTRDALNELKDGEFKPFATEIAITDKKGAYSIPSLSLTLEDGEKAYLTGVIDRVDTYKKDGTTYIKLVDYKSGHVDFRAEKLSELENIQLFLYMLSVCDSKGVVNSPVAAAVYYMETTSSAGELTSSEEAQTDTPLKRGGAVLAEPDVLNAIEHGLDSGKGKRVKVGAGKIKICTDSEFENLFQTVKSSVGAEAMKIKRADAGITAKEGQDSPCKYCPYTAVCRYTKNKID